MIATASSTFVWIAQRYSTKNTLKRLLGASKVPGAELFIEVKPIVKPKSLVYLTFEETKMGDCSCEGNYFSLQGPSCCPEGQFKCEDSCCDKCCENGVCQECDPDGSGSGGGIGGDIP